MLLLPSLSNLSQSERRRARSASPPPTTAWVADFPDKKHQQANRKCSVKKTDQKQKERQRIEDTIQRQQLILILVSLSYRGAARQRRAWQRQPPTAQRGRAQCRGRGWRSSDHARRLTPLLWPADLPRYENPRSMRPTARD